MIERTRRLLARWLRSCSSLALAAAWQLPEMGWLRLAAAGCRRGRADDAALDDARRRAARPGRLRCRRRHVRRDSAHRPCAARRPPCQGRAPRLRQPHGGGTGAWVGGAGALRTRGGEPDPAARPRLHPRCRGGTRRPDSRHPAAGRRRGCVCAARSRRRASTRSAPCVVIGGNDLGPRSWIEQVAPRIAEVPFLAVTPTVLLPEVQPYLDSGGLPAVLGTPRDGAAYREGLELGNLARSDRSDGAATACPCSSGCSSPSRCSARRSAPGR